MCAVVIRGMTRPIARAQHEATVDDADEQVGDRERFVERRAGLPEVDDLVVGEHGPREDVLPTRFCGRCTISAKIASGRGLLGGA